MTRVNIHKKLSTLGTGEASSVPCSADTKKRAATFIFCANNLKSYTARYKGGREYRHLPQHSVNTKHRDARLASPHLVHGELVKASNTE